MTIIPAERRIIAADMILDSNVRVAVRDGVELATDIYLPAQDSEPLAGRFPVILERTPYGRNRASRSEIPAGAREPMSRAEVAAPFVRAGFAVIYQDCRGRYDSGGAFIKYLSDGEDGFDTMAWIGAQDWCDGQIGTMGLSYAAHTQMAAACLNPPGLRAMVLDSGGFSSAYRCGIRQGGAFEMKQATWAWNQARESRRAEADPLVRQSIEAEDIFAWFRASPWSAGRSPVRAEPEYESYLLEQWRRGTFDDFWRKPGIYAAGSYDAMPPIPVALMSSWYDVYVHTTFDNYAGLGRKSERPLNVIMGPWTHGDRNKRVFGDVDFGPDALFDNHVATDWLAWRLAFFNRWLKGVAQPDEPRLRLFVMGGGSGRKTQKGNLDHGGQWRTFADWPLPDADTQSWYFHRDGRMDRAMPAEAHASVAYKFDPADPVPTIGGALTSGKPVFEGGAYDQREDARFFGCRNPGLPLSARRDVLTFETEPLDEDIAVIGPILVDLWVTSDAPDTDFTAKLIDVYPPSPDYPAGYAMNITDGIFRCRYRDGFDRPRLIDEGEIFRISIEPFATANLFARGHRIRIDISSSNFPKFDVNPNSGEPEGEGRMPRAAINRVFLSNERPSRVILPVARVKD